MPFIGTKNYTMKFVDSKNIFSARRDQIDVYIGLQYHGKHKRCCYWICCSAASELFLLEITSVANQSRDNVEIWESMLLISSFTGFVIALSL